ncbi:MAG: hypothetical protein IT572_07315 [Deltaproteobacteria bacterium]|nr:hypothetical protein [Deltaproteobacteria bacterium]
MTIRIDRTWLSHLDAPGRAELESLSHKTDADLLEEALLAFAGRQERAERPEVAARIYAALAQDAESPRHRQRAQHHLDAMEGRGPLGARAEFLLRGLARQGSDPALIGSMLAAGTVFRMTRLATLSRLTANPTASFLTRGLGARATAGLAGFALEAPAFTLAGRLGNAALARDLEGSSPSFARELASSYLVLGGMKLAGWLSGSLYRGLAGPVGAVRERPLRTLFQQGGMLSGILLGHSLEERLGLRPPQSAAHTLIDSLAMLLHGHVAGRLGGAALGPRFRAWEGGLDLQAKGLAQSRLRAPRLAPQVALALPGGGEFRLPNVLQMSSHEFDPKLTLPGAAPARPAESEARAPVPPPDPLAPLRAPRLLRTRESNPLGDGPRLWNYELVLEPLENFLSPGAERVVATRDGREIRLRLDEAFRTQEQNDFYNGGVPAYEFEVIEGPHRGRLTIYLEPDRIHLFSIRTQEPGMDGREMIPGAGTILFDWLATQAAQRGQLFSVLGITEPRVFHILNQHSLFLPGTAWVEAARFKRPYGHRVVEVGRLGDGAFLYRHTGKGFYNAWGQPNSELLPPTLRSAVAKRAGERPYEIQVDPLRNFLNLGHEAVIARRDGREIRARVTGSRLAGPEDRFMPAGTHLLELELSEGGERGLLQMYVEPGRLIPANLITQEGPYRMPAGAGTVILDWIYTQAAIHGMEIHHLNVKNSQIVRILSRRGLMVPESARVQAGYWDFVYGTFEPEGSLPYREEALLQHFAPRLFAMSPLLQIQGRPNPELIPPPLRPEPSD